jgi:uncharacterized surface protein with fasciclin (FAS1) repeats
MFRKLIASVMLASLALTAIVPATVSAAGGKDIAERLIQRNDATGKFDTLLTAATCVEFRSDPEDPFSSEIVALLQSEGPLTLFAPTDAAFAKLALDASNICSALDPQTELKPILQYHVHVGKASYRAARQLARADVPLTMADGNPAVIDGRPGRLKIDGARIIQRNTPANNGLIHVVNDVLLPPVS